MILLRIFQGDAGTANSCDATPSAAGLEVFLGFPGIVGVRQAAKLGAVPDMPGRSFRAEHAARDVLRHGRRVNGVGTGFDLVASQYA